MIIVSNPYRGVREFNTANAAELKDEDPDRLDEMLELAQLAFEEGAKMQLTACIRDLTIWASHYEHIGRHQGDPTLLLTAFGIDWSKEHEATGRFGPRTV